MRNNNQEVMRRLSMRSLKNNKMRNFFAVAAIALTCMLFTTLAAMGTGMMDVAQESTMREVGGRFHAGLKAATWEQVEKVTADTRVKDYSWNIFIGVADNLKKRQCEIRLAQGEKELENSFIELAEGRMPQAENELIVDTYVFDELKLPHELGTQIPLEFSFHGETVKETFRVCGWYEGSAIGHASELYVSEDYWKKLKGNLTDEEFVSWGEQHPNDAGSGLYAVGLYFDSPKQIEEKVRAIITEAGYEPDVTLNYGVNWAYMQNRAEAIDPLSMVIMGVALIVILITGYLIIYNIFYISVFQDIRFYGLLKTIGTTKRQIKRMIRRQALLLSVAGIPIGLAAGYLASSFIFPIAMQMATYGFDIKLKFHPQVAVFGIVFALITVFISCRKPGKIAGSVSPVEAVRYTEGGNGRKKVRRSETGARIHRMALSNLGRNKKKTALVLFSLSLSMVLLCVVLTGVGSFRLDSYLSSRLLGDVMLGCNYVMGGGAGGIVTTDQVDPQYVELADAQPGVISKNEIWQIYGITDIKMDDTAMERYQSFVDEEILSQDGWGKMVIEEILEKKQIEADVYAYDTEILSGLKVLGGTLDPEKFAKGGYVLLTDIIGDHTEGKRIYEPGEKITVLTPDENSEFVEIKDEDGNTLSGYWENMKETEYEVMAIVEIPPSMLDGGYPVNAVQAILPLEDVKASPYSWRLSVSYEVEEEALPAFTKVIADYSENVNTDMGYMTKASLMEEFSTMVNAIRIIGIALGAVIALIGILNFINSVVTGILARKRELAILCSIGMTQSQLKKMLLEEGLYYVLISGLISLILGTGLSYLVMTALNNVILFFVYRPNFLAFLIMLPLLAVLAAVVPTVAYRRMQKESIVQRLRDTES
ncbi:MAG: ABC transporter permease [Marvinbryantia sp.]|jgi:putative ABC transport system permease protein